MIKIITAMNNPELNEKLKKEENIEILANDICYDDGIFEIIEKYKKIDFLLISKKIYTNNKIEEMINIIKEKNNKIKIILFVEKNYEKIINKNIYKIVDEKIELKNLIKIIKDENYIETKENKKIITILGTRGIGKTTFSLILAKTITKMEKILILTLNAKSFIDYKKINKNIYLNTRGVNFNQGYKYIFVETDIITKPILENTNLFIFLIGGNLIEIQKAKELLEIYSKKIKNIKIIVNKYTEESLDMGILKNIFNDYEIIGKINYNAKYDLIANKKIRKINKEIRQDYNLIIRKIKNGKFNKKIRKDGKNYGISIKTK